MVKDRAPKQVHNTGSLLHYETYGDSWRPPLVFLHGFMGDASDWDVVISPLSGEYYCVALDLPGHGRSLHVKGRGDHPAQCYSLPETAEAVMAVVERECSAPATLIGYSMGGRVGLYLAARFPAACARLVVESATPGIADPKERSRRLERDERRARQLREGGLTDFLNGWYRQPIFETVSESPTRLASLIRKRSGNDPLVLADVLTGMSVGRQEPLWNELPPFDIPVLLLAGERDEKYVKIIRDMGEALPRAAVEIIPGCGHTVHLEDPAEFALRLDRFIRRPNGESGSVMSRDGHQA